MVWIIKPVPFGFLWVTNKVTTDSLRIQFFSCGLYIRASAGQPQTCRCLKLGFLPVYNSKGVLGTALLGILFSKYTAVLSAYVHKDLGNEELLIILLTISINVLFRLSITLFYWGVPGIVYCAHMPCLSRNFANGPGFCPDSPCFP